MENTPSHPSQPSERRPRPHPRPGRRYPNRRPPRPQPPRGSNETALLTSVPEAPIERPSSPVETRRSGGSPLEDALLEVESIRVKLEGLLEDMEHVLDLLTRAEQDKIGTEREIESLRRSLRSLHRPSQRPPSYREAPSAQEPGTDEDPGSREEG